MFSQVLTLSVAVLCAFWAQGVVLCAGEEGHTEFEVQGSCCPTEDGDCHDCVDTTSPDPLIPVVVSTPDLGPSTESQAHLVSGPVGHAASGSWLASLLTLQSLQSVVLVV